MQAVTVDNSSQQGLFNSLLLFPWVNDVQPLFGGSSLLICVLGSRLTCPLGRAFLSFSLILFLFIPLSIKLFHNSALSSGRVPGLVGVEGGYYPGGDVMLKTSWESLSLPRRPAPGSFFVESCIAFCWQHAEAIHYPCHLAVRGLALFGVFIFLNFPFLLCKTERWMGGLLRSRPGVSSPCIGTCSGSVKACSPQVLQVPWATSWIPQWVGLAPTQWCVLQWW